MWWLECSTGLRRADFIKAADFEIRATKAFCRPRLPFCKTLKVGLGRDKQPVKNNFNFQIIFISYANCCKRKVFCYLTILANFQRITRLFVYLKQNFDSFDRHYLLRKNNEKGNHHPIFKLSKKAKIKFLKLQ